MSDTNTNTKNIHPNYFRFPTNDHLRQLMDRLYIDAWIKKGFRFREISSVTRFYRWDIIYKSLISGYALAPAVRGKAKAGYSIPDYVANILSKRQLSFQKWCNAYQTSTAVAEEALAERAEWILNLMSNDFPYIERDSVPDDDLPKNAPAESIRSRDYLGIITIKPDDKSTEGFWAIPASREILAGYGATQNTCLNALIAKATTAIRAERLYAAIHNEKLEIDDVLKKYS